MRFLRFGRNALWCACTFFDSSAFGVSSTHPLSAGSLRMTGLCILDADTSLHLLVDSSMYLFADTSLHLFVGTSLAVGLVTLVTKKCQNILLLSPRCNDFALKPSNYPTLV